jgi:hypothetical protein
MGRQAMNSRPGDVALIIGVEHGADPRAEFVKACVEHRWNPQHYDLTEITDVLGVTARRVFTISRKQSLN